jgi:hypothetical protein
LPPEDPNPRGQLGKSLWIVEVEDAPKGGPTKRTLPLEQLGGLPTRGQNPLGSEGR